MLQKGPGEGPYKTHKGKNIAHLDITTQGIDELKRGQ